MKKTKIINLLKGGNFTLAYHDNGYCCLYNGKLKYKNLPDEGELAEFSGNENGYIPVEVEYLVKALGGKVESV